MIDLKLKQVIASGIFSIVVAFSATAVTPTSVKVAWDASPGSDVSGYRVHYGTASGSYNRTVDAGAKATASLNDLASGTTYYFVVTAYNTAGIESSPSSEISYTPDAGSPLQLTSLPESQVVTRGSSVTLSVAAEGAEPVRYQWNKAGVAIAGATGSAYTITNVDSSRVGTYSVTVVDNNSSTSTPAVAVSTMQMQKPRQIAIEGVPGASFAIASSDNLAGNVWSNVATVALTSNQVQWVDTSATNVSQRFYRVSPAK